MANRITNPTFDAGVTNWNASQATKAQDTTEHHTGTGSMKLTATTTNFPGAYSNAITMVVGNSYRWSLWLKGTGTVRPGFFSGTYISGSTADCVMSPSAWTQFQFDWVATVTSAFLYIGGVGMSVGAVYWVDDVSVDDTPAPPPPAGGGGSLVRAAAKKALADKVVRAGVKKSPTLYVVRAGAKKVLT